VIYLDLYLDTLSMESTVDNYLLFTRSAQTRSIWSCSKFDVAHGVDNDSGRLSRMVQLAVVLLKGAKLSVTLPFNAAMTDLCPF